MKASIDRAGRKCGQYKTCTTDVVGDMTEAGRDGSTQAPREVGRDGTAQAPRELPFLACVYWDTCKKRRSQGFFFCLGKCDANCSAQTVGQAPYSDSDILCGPFLTHSSDSPVLARAVYGLSVVSRYTHAV